MATLFHFLPVYLVFATLAAFAWLHGGARADALMPTIPWLWAFLFEGLLFFPQRRPHEDPLQARRRVWHDLRTDPLVYTTLLFLFVLAIPFTNRGLCPSCDAAAIAQGAVASPPISFIPSCLDPSEHFGVFLWFLPSLTAMLAAKYALSRSGKRLLVEMLVWNAAALAVLGFIQRATGATSAFWGTTPAGPDFFSVFGYANMGGSFFTMALAFSIGLWQTRIGEVSQLPHLEKGNGSISKQRLNRFLMAHYALVAVVLNFFGAIFTLSRAAIMLSFILAGLGFVYYECSLLLARHHRAKRVKSAAFVFFGGLLFLFAVSVFAPDNLSKEMKSLDAMSVADRVSGRAQYHSRVALAVFKDHPVWGVGGWGYRHHFGNYLTEEESKHIQTVGGANVHNDYLQFLCEHGLVGAGALLAIFVMLLVPIFTDWYRLLLAARFTKSDKAPPMPRAIYCLPPGTFWILLGNLALMIHAFGDCPMRSGACLSTFFVTLACAQGFIPRGSEDSAK